jgi:hypothetical protein
MVDPFRFEKNLNWLETTIKHKHIKQARKEIKVQVEKTVKVGASAPFTAKPVATTQRQERRQRSLKLRAFRLFRVFLWFVAYLPSFPKSPFAVLLLQYLPIVKIAFPPTHTPLFFGDHRVIGGAE